MSHLKYLCLMPLNSADRTSCCVRAQTPRGSAKQPWAALWRGRACREPVGTFTGPHQQPQDLDSAGPGSPAAEQGSPVDSQIPVESSRAEPETPAVRGKSLQEAAIAQETKEPEGEQPIKWYPAGGTDTAHCLDSGANIG